MKEACTYTSALVNAYWTVEGPCTIFIGLGNPQPSLSAESLSTLSPALDVSAAPAAASPVVVAVALAH